MLSSSPSSVSSALKRGRASLQDRFSPTADRQAPPQAKSPAENAVAEKFARAWESTDLEALVDLLTDDVFISMPPMPFEYVGREAAARFCAVLLDPRRRFDLVPARTNGQPAFAAYLRVPGGLSRGVGVYVLTLAGARICAMSRFESSVLPFFGFPGSLASR